jgi:hypothetical protein
MGRDLKLAAFSISPTVRGIKLKSISMPPLFGYLKLVIFLYCL